MHGSRRTLCGCTVVDLPKSEDDREESRYMLKAPSQLDALRPPMSPSLQRAPDHPTPLHPFATSPVPVMFGPNITGSLYAGGIFSCYEAVGALAGSNVGNRNRGATHSDAKNTQVLELLFKADNSNDLYGSSSSVQPSSLRLLPCIKT